MHVICLFINRRKEIHSSLPTCSKGIYEKKEIMDHNGFKNKFIILRSQIFKELSIYFDVCNNSKLRE